MLINQIYLRNFRVYEDELVLDVPPGLVGIYGPNGAGKSTLLEAIVFALWGRGRTAKDGIRSTGVNHEAVAEVTFEHEGHLYEVRRTLSGINTTVKAQVRTDGLDMAVGVRDTAQYLHSVLGMDDVAFRASVFAEQKQLAAFSSQAPAERRRLVLQLLGITPLDGARDAARKDARQAVEDHRRVREVLPDLDALEVTAADADARAGAAEVTADLEEAALVELSARATEAAQARVQVDAGRAQYDALVREGRAARADLDRLTEELATLTTEEEQLTAAAADLADAQARSASMDRDEAVFAALQAWADASSTLDRLPDLPEVPVPDPGPRDGALTAAHTARTDIASARALVTSVEGEVARATEAASRSSDLSGEGMCPLCGQALGDAFTSVQEHRRAEVAEAEGRLAGRRADLEAIEDRARAAMIALDGAEHSYREASEARTSWEAVAARRVEVSATVGRARELAGSLGAPGTTDPTSARDEAHIRLQGSRAAAAEAARLRGRLERHPVVVRRMAVVGPALDDARSRVEDLRAQVKALDFDAARVDAARTAHEEADGRRAAADRTARQARLVATQERTRAEGEARRLTEARAQHESIAALQDTARHLRRLADLLNDFRNTVVASVGPRLSTHAAELFAELTDREYDELVVDPETFELQITDGGRTFGLDRFSGSEIDLANLALRVAISEHVRFQSGGSVGLLVLDEVFGPLDDERKLRMLQALQRLGARFRQVLVVTHDNEIKEQLPHAIEVVKLPGRRATARVSGG